MKTRDWRSIISGSEVKNRQSTWKEQQTVASLERQPALGCRSLSMRFCGHLFVCGLLGVVALLWSSHIFYFLEYLAPTRETE
jgi:hypothetical protein